MSTRHRVAQAMRKLAENQDQNWDYETWSDDKTATFAFASARSAELISEALRHMFKSTRPQLIHNGHKPKRKR